MKVGHEFNSPDHLLSFKTQVLKNYEMAKLNALNWCIEMAGC